MPFPGWEKLLGGIAILVPGWPRLKEWAHAGLFFDLLGATYSVYALDKFPWMLFTIGLGAGSSMLYQKKRQTTMNTRLKTRLSY